MKDEKEVKTVKLENGIEYIIVDEIIDKDKYLILVNEMNDLDVCIRKVIVENNEEYIIGLDSDEELNKILNLYYKKNS